jgi:hypothetical protein
MNSPLAMLKGLSSAMMVVALAVITVPAAAQTRDVDPGAALGARALPAEASTTVVDDVIPADAPQPGTDAVPASDGSPALPAGKTYAKDDLIAGAEGAFGKGAKGLAKMIEAVLADQGEPNAYIAGREASGAIVVGLRYGSGTMSHAVEGQRPVYWTGPSIGFDLGGDAANVFALVYNLYDSQELYRRYPQVEGRAYYVGGLSATYLRRGNIVIIPIRLGVGLRAGINAGYMKFSEKNKWMPF